MKKYIKEFIKTFGRFSDFSGRSDRYAFIMFFIISILLGLITSLIFPLLGILTFFILIVPTISLRVRRLHDTNNSGWLIIIEYLLYLIFIVLLVKDNNYYLMNIGGMIPIGFSFYLMYLTMIKKGDIDSNKYGEPFNRES